MNLKFFPKKTWLRGGTIGVIACIVLFFFYIFIYFPVIDKIYDKDIETHGGTPLWTTTIPLVTGHFFPLLSGFIVPYGFLCEFTESVCTYWSAKNEPGGVPWTIDGQAGYYIEQTMTPTDSCANFSERIGFWGITAILVLIYFVIGSIIGKLIKKKKEK